MSVGWMNGKIQKEEEMVLPVRDLGILRGFGVFDFIRTYNKIPFHLEDHIMRLQHSAEQIGLVIPYNIYEIEKAMLDVLKNSDLPEAGLRIVCTGGMSSTGLPSKDGANLFILADPLRTPPAEVYIKGGKVITYPHTRHNPEAKSLNYIAAMEAMSKAREEGAVEALYMDEHHRILEGTTSNFFVRKDGVWLTPGKEVLKGITRQVVLSLIPERELIYSDVYLTDLNEAEEVFITASSKEILPIVLVDDKPIGSGVPGPETLKLMAAFREYVNTPKKWAFTVESGDGSV